jgi:hypothetical protein
MDTTDAPQIIEHIRKSVTCTPYDVKWVPCSARLVCMGINPKVQTHTRSLLLNPCMNHVYYVLPETVSQALLSPVLL